MFAASPLAIRLGGINTFDDNRAYAGGSIYNEEGSSFSPPQDGGELIFQNNVAEVGAHIFVLQWRFGSYAVEGCDGR